MKNFGLDINIGGKSVPEYIASLVDRNERNEIDIERGKLSIAAMKQLNNYCRLLLDVKKYELKRMEFDYNKLKDEARTSDLRSDTEQE